MERQAALREVARRERCRAAAAELQSQMSDPANAGGGRRGSLIGARTSVADEAGGKRSSILGSGWVGALVEAGRKRGSIIGGRASLPARGSVAAAPPTGTTNRRSIFAYTQRRSIASAVPISAIERMTVVVRNGLDPQVAPAPHPQSHHAPRSATPPSSMEPLAGHGRLIRRGRTRRVPVHVPHRRVISS